MAAGQSSYTSPAAAATHSCNKELRLAIDSSISHRLLGAADTMYVPAFMLTRLGLSVEVKIYGRALRDCNAR
jgi:hypothetical protein